MAAGCPATVPGSARAAIRFAFRKPARINAAGSVEIARVRGRMPALRSPVYTVTLYEPDNTGMRGAFKRCFAPLKNHWAYGKTVRAGPFGHGSGGWSENNPQLTGCMGPCARSKRRQSRWRRIRGVGGNVFRKTETTCDPIHKLQCPSFHKGNVRRARATRAGIQQCGSRNDALRIFFSDLLHREARDLNIRARCGLAAGHSWVRYMCRTG